MMERWRTEAGSGIFMCIQKRSEERFLLSCADPQINDAGVQAVRGLSPEPQYCKSPLAQGKEGFCL